MHPRHVGQIASRAAALLLVWIILGRTGAADLVVGAVVAFGLSIVSLQVAPVLDWTPNIIGLLRYAARFVVRSVAAGLDVARRVFSADMGLQPGIVDVPCAVPEGVARQAFAALSSLQPGTLPLASEAATLRVHTLDASAPLAADMAADAAAFMAAGRSRAP